VSGSTNPSALSAEAVLHSIPATAPHGTCIGYSRENRPIYGFVCGTGSSRISLIAGCHADEPVGPETLKRLVAYLINNPDHPRLATYQFWIVPDVNPDGALRNKAWSDCIQDDRYDISTYLTHVSRETPGDDIEFGFPGSHPIVEVRPEPRAVYDWWAISEDPVAMHASLHGLSLGAGPWFLIDPEWSDRATPLISTCRDRVSTLGYNLHDVERNGEKGFTRIERGFCTRPNHLAMRAYFEERGDRDMAARFQRSSMEAIRDFGDSPLTLVSEIPLFITPKIPLDDIPRRDALPLRQEMMQWSADLAGGRDPDLVSSEAQRAGLNGFPIGDQMTLQLAFIEAGIDLIESGHSPHSS
jgi:hypothetical protein